MEDNAENPFASPLPVGDRLQSPIVSRVPGCKAFLLKKSLLYRKIQVDAPVVAVIEYLGRTLRDKIIVNGEIVVWRLPIVGLSHTFHFLIATEPEPLSASIQVKVNPFVQITYFDLTIDGTSVYRENGKRA